MKIVLTAVPAATAEEIAEKVVGERLAACASIVAGIRSIYRWQGAVERAEESQIVMKTSDSKVSALVARVAALHPYEVPEIVCIEPSSVHAPYASWVSVETCDAP